MERRFNNGEERIVGINDLVPEGLRRHHLPHMEEEEGAISDLESSASSGIGGAGDSSEVNSSFFSSGSGAVRLNEGDAIHGMISQKFLTNLAEFGMHTKIEAIHRYTNMDLTSQAKLAAFLKFLKATEEKNKGSNPCWRYAWYCGSKKNIDTVLSYGFGHTVNDGVYGRGIYLSSVGHPLQSVHLSTPDENGLRHLLLCRVILGSMELVPPGSHQCHPSSKEFDSGVDNLLLPTKYIIWGTHMNTHILPEFVVSIRAPSPPPITRGNSQFSVHLKKKPNSPWLPLTRLIPILSNYLPPKNIERIQKFQTDFRERRISRTELIQQVRSITGDILLAGVIKGYTAQLKK